jgi:hypothetical protein
MRVIARMPNEAVDAGAAAGASGGDEVSLVLGSVVEFGAAAVVTT